jgi:hypothetical protein
MRSFEYYLEQSPEAAAAYLRAQAVLLRAVSDESLNDPTILTFVDELADKLNAETNAFLNTCFGFDREKNGFGMLKSLNEKLRYIDLDDPVIKKVMEKKPSDSKEVMDTVQAICKINPFQKLRPKPEFNISKDHLVGIVEQLWEENVAFFRLIRHLDFVLELQETLLQQAFSIPNTGQQLEAGYKSVKDHVRQGVLGSKLEVVK